MAEQYLLFACHSRLFPACLGAAAVPQPLPAPAPLAAQHPQRGAPITGSAQLGAQLGLAEEMFLLPKPARCSASGTEGTGLYVPSQGWASKYPGREGLCSCPQAPPHGHGLLRCTGTGHQARGYLEEWSNPLILLEVGVWHQPLVHQSSHQGSW